MLILEIALGIVLAVVALRLIGAFGAFLAFMLEPELGRPQYHQLTPAEAAEAYEQRGTVARTIERTMPKIALTVLGVIGACVLVALLEHTAGGGP